LSAALFQHVIDVDRVNLIDFGTGNDAYKAEWMEDVRERYRLEMFWPNNPANWPYIAIRKWRAYRASN
jgi:CelD/BcsL family acetyltransferase involved in cellulose biosynthesis